MWWSTEFPSRDRTPCDGLLNSRAGTKLRAMVSPTATWHCLDIRLHTRNAPGSSRYPGQDGGHAYNYALPTFGTCMLGPNCKWVNKLHDLTRTSLTGCWSVDDQISKKCLSCVIGCVKSFIRGNPCEQAWDKLNRKNSSLYVVSNSSPLTLGASLRVF